jgi:hypothetical protein
MSTNKEYGLGRAGFEGHVSLSPTNVKLREDGLEVLETFHRTKGL